MKTYITAILLMLLTLHTGAQTKSFSKESFIASYKLEVTNNKTTNLVFPAAITSVDRGSRDILVQQAPGVENILRVKADVKNFPETNLSVITADGKLYSFIVSYTIQPAYLNVNVGSLTERDTVVRVMYAEPVVNKSMLTGYADSINTMGANIRSVRTESSGVSVALKGLYIHEDILFLHFDLINDSPINFDIDQLHFYIRDKNMAKRTASQEIEIHPVSVTGNSKTIHSLSKESWIVALQKFTIPDGKYLSVEVMEKNGGRNLFLKIKGRKIMKAKII